MLIGAISAQKRRIWVFSSDHGRPKTGRVASRFAGGRLESPIRNSSTKQRCLIQMRPPPASPSVCAEHVIYHSILKAKGATIAVGQQCADELWASPALAHLLNHFGSSLFSYKPSAIVTYSAGQWGGTRAAVGMRTFLSELGCLPVSAMIHLPKVQEVLTEEGDFIDQVDAQAWRGYFGRTLSQLEWWAAATAAHRTVEGAPVASPAFNRDPSQRNAPEQS
jgi:hypothetical protein